MMKNAAIVSLLVILLSACATAPGNSNDLTVEPKPVVTILPSTASTPQPGTPSAPGPTELFITQVMATKYAGRTEYAAMPTATPTPTIPPDSPGCVPADLQTSFHSNVYTGRIGLEVSVTNIGGAPCYLPDWPQVELLDRSGKAIDVTYDYIYPDANPSLQPPTQESNPGKPLVYGMQAMQAAGIVLLWGNWCGQAIQGGVVIRMFLLGNNAWIDIPSDIEGGGYCDDPGSPSTVDIIGFGY